MITLHFDIKNITSRLSDAFWESQAVKKGRF